jgi:hypothetical protein
MVRDNILRDLGKYECVVGTLPAGNVFSVLRSSGAGDLVFERNGVEIDDDEGGNKPHRGSNASPSVL